VTRPLRRSRNSCREREWSRPGTTVAKDVVAGLARDAGYDPWDAGPLRSAHNLEKVAAVLETIAYVVGEGTHQAIRIVRW
jgi:hypothetical protein